ncbi:MAG: MlaD family protein, partial [Pseudobdellovibrio sp.]
MKYESQMKRSKLAWVVWLFPIVALLIITSMYIHERNEEGTYITINFKSADGLIEGRTPVKYRGVTIGTIQSIKITEDDTSVDALVEIKKEYHKYVVKNSRFWLVEPQISLSGISGLSTLKDGVYIAVEPGPLNGDYQDNFKISTAPSAKFEKPNLVSYFLKTNHLKSITINDQINYRGVPIGQVVGVSLGKHGAYASVQ